MLRLLETIKSHINHKMKTFMKYEFIGWLALWVLFTIAYAIIGIDNFVLLSLVIIIMGRIAELKNEINSNDK